MKNLRLMSDILFWAANLTLIISVVLLEIGTKYMREKKNLKRKKLDRVAMKFMLVAGILYLSSFLLALA